VGPAHTHANTYTRKLQSNKQSHTQEIRPRGVVWRWASLPAGTHVMTYQAVAATQGDFLLPAIKASVDDQPEVCALHCTALHCFGGEGRGQGERGVWPVEWIVDNVGSL
jgi:hypothetical protein